MNITAKFTLYDEKVHSVRYNEDGPSSDHILKSAYVSKKSLPRPFPQVLYITVSDAERSDA